MVAEFYISRENHQTLAKLMTDLMEPLSYYDWKNGHFSDRHLTSVRRMTICNGLISSEEEPVITFHTYSKYDVENELKFTVTKVGPKKVELDFTIGELSDETLNLIISESEALLLKVKASAAEKKRRALLTKEEKKRLGFSTKHWRGLYIYRGGINETSEHWVNYEEAVRLNIASPEFVQSMKEMKLHFQRK